MRGNRSRPSVLAMLTLLLSVGQAVAADYQIKPEVLQRAMSGEAGVFGLPQVRIYGGDGYLLSDLGVGYLPGRLAEALEQAMKPDAKSDRARSLVVELADFETEGGDEPPLPRCAELYVVKYWAEWCKPCHLVDAELEAYLAEHPERSIEVVSVEADPDRLAEIAAPAAEAQP